jgi:hypothetical protein
MAITTELNPEIKQLIDNIELSDDLTVEDLSWVFYRLDQDFDSTDIDDLLKMTVHVQYLCTRIEDTYGIKSARVIMLIHMISAEAPQEIIDSVKNISTFH